MIRAQGLSKRFEDGTLALDGVSLSVSPGEFVAVIGRSGSGKSTFLRHINGMLQPTSGKLEVLDCNVGQAGSSDLRKLRAKIGFIFQQFNLVKTLSAFENVLIGRLGRYSALRGALGLFSEGDRKLALQYLKDVGLDERSDTRVERLSGGQQQRVAIARALVQDPKIILADEPMASLDPKLSEVVLDLLTQFNKSRGITVIVNIHVLELAKKYAPRIIALKAGRVAYDGPSNGLTENKLREIYD